MPLNKTLYLSPEFLFLSNNKTKWRAILGLSVFVFLILFLLQPFNSIIHGFTLIGIARILTYGLVTGLALFIGEFYLIRPFKAHIAKGKFYQPLLWYLFELLLATSLIFVIKNAWSNFDYLSWADYLLVMQRVGSIAIFPFAILLIFLFNRNPSSQQILLKSSQKSEHLMVPITSILFLQSTDNYTTVFYMNKTQLKRKILRGSLASFENQTKYPLMRCHRSYIVNLAAIESLVGNSQGYNLNMKGSDITLKVSRKYLKKFELNWSKYSSESLSI